MACVDLSASHHNEVNKGDETPPSLTLSHGSGALAPAVSNHPKSSPSQGRRTMNVSMGNSVSNAAPVNTNALQESQKREFDVDFAYDGPVSGTFNMRPLMMESPMISCSGEQMEFTVDGKGDYISSELSPANGYRLPNIMGPGSGSGVHMPPSLRDFSISRSPQQLQVPQQQQQQRQLRQSSESPGAGMVLPNTSFCTPDCSMEEVLPGMKHKRAGMDAIHPPQDSSVTQVTMSLAPVSETMHSEVANLNGSAYTTRTEPWRELPKADRKRMVADWISASKTEGEEKD